MGAPKKIYVTTSELTELLATRRHDYDVEYTRTDAFIEKACKFLQEQVLNDYPGVVWEGLIKEFKNYMKGE